MRPTVPARRAGLPRAARVGPEPPVSSDGSPHHLRHRSSSSRGALPEDGNRPAGRADWPDAREAHGSLITHALCRLDLHGQFPPVCPPSDRPRARGVRRCGRHPDCALDRSHETAFNPFTVRRGRPASHRRHAISAQGRRRRRVKRGPMPEKSTIERARRDKRAGKASTTQAGEFVREEIDHIREGKHGARSTKQAIAIGLSKARRAGVRLPRPPASAKATTKRSAASATRLGRRRRRPSPRRSRAVVGALKREGKAAASRQALARQARTAARRRPRAARRAAAGRAVRTKGPRARREAARKAARTRQRRRRGAA
jgi:hypothetical protein